MKAWLQRFLRLLGYEIRPLTGAMRSPTMATALTWLGGQRIDVRTVLDVGASDGRWSVEALRVYPDATFVLYEPNPVHLPGLRSFVDQRAGQVVHAPYAVGSTDGTAPFDDRDAFGGALLDAAAPDDGRPSIDVPTTTLDTSVAQLDLSGPFLVKLDTHGFERGIIDGAADVLDAASILIIEAYAHRLTSEGLYFWELCALLHDRGFRPADLVDVMHRERDGSLWQMDIVFLRDTWPGFAAASYR